MEIPTNWTARRIAKFVLAISALALALFFVLAVAEYYTRDSRIVPSVSVEGEEAIARTYEWLYQRCNWTWDVAIPKELYDFYGVKARPVTRDYSVYVTHPDDDAYLELLADHLKQAASEAEYDTWQIAHFAAGFVQSLPQVDDFETAGQKEYPRYPIETLVDGGDCEDTSILLAALLDEMDYGIVLLVISPEEPSAPGHCAVGVEGDESLSGWYYEHSGKKYFYLETTGKGWNIGDIPDEYKEESARIYDIVS